MVNVTLTLDVSSKTSKTSPFRKPYKTSNKLDWSQIKEFLISTIWHREFIYFIGPIVHHQELIFKAFGLLFFSGNDFETSPPLGDMLGRQGLCNSLHFGEDQAM